MYTKRYHRPVVEKDRCMGNKTEMVRDVTAEEAVKAFREVTFNKQVLEVMAN